MSSDAISSHYRMAVNRAGSIALTVHGPLHRDDLPGLYARACALLEHNAGKVVICDAGEIAADAVSADALARLQLAARRHGCRVTVRGASNELRELIAFIGLAEVLPEGRL